MGANEIGLHADQNWFPAPFPIHNQLFTVCWALDDFTKKGGCTKVIPGSHKKRRHPLPDEIVVVIPTFSNSECVRDNLVEI